VGSEQSWSKEGTVRHPKARKPAYYDHIVRKQGAGERDNARNNARCMQAKKTTHGLDGYQDVFWTACGRVSQNDRDKRRRYVHGMANPWIKDV